MDLVNKGLFILINYYIGVTYIFGWAYYPRFQVTNYLTILVLLISIKVLEINIKIFKLKLMNNKNIQNYLFKNYEYIFFIFFFIVGLLSFKDYGISWDEKMSRGVGFLNGKYILENYFNDIYQKIIYNNENIKFGKLENYNLENYPERAYGVSFELPTV